jgi:hypothetical protein
MIRKWDISISIKYQFEKIDEQKRYQVTIWSTDRDVSNWDDATQS